MDTSQKCRLLAVSRPQWVVENPTQRVDCGHSLRATPLTGEQDEAADDDF